MEGLVAPRWVRKCSEILLAKLEKFEDGVFTLKTHHVLLDFCLRRTRAGNHMTVVTSSFSKSLVFKMFSAHTKTKSQRFQIPPV